MIRKINWDEDMARNAVALLGSAASVVEPEERAKLVQGDEADNLVLACALESRADYLVTGDQRHLLPLGEARGVKIITAAQFLSVLENAETPQ